MAALRDLLFELPFRAGTRTVQANLEEVAQATLHYYRYGVTHPSEAALPVGVTDGASTSNQHDIAAVAGYLALEQRFGRVSAGVVPEHAAGLLMGALVARALGDDGHSGQEFTGGLAPVADPMAGMSTERQPSPEFTGGLVQILLEGIAQGATGHRGSP
ncbi:MAG: hypothetical protein ACT4OM_13810 [Actinomycetota bacterium]